MNKKFMGLAFVVIVAGCQPPQQGAVCPAAEEEVAAPEPVPDNPQIDNDPELQREVERAERRTRATRRQ